MKGPEHMVEFFHGYTYSAHPLLRGSDGDAGCLSRRAALSSGEAAGADWADAIHSLKGLPNVLDIRPLA